MVKHSPTFEEALIALDHEGYYRLPLGERELLIATVRTKDKLSAVVNELMTPTKP